MLSIYIKYITLTFISVIALLILAAFSKGGSIAFTQYIYYIFAGTFFIGTGIFLGKLFRDFTQPDAFLTSGAVDTFKTKIFWMIGPQVIGAIIGLIATEGLEKNIFKNHPQVEVELSPTIQPPASSPSTSAEPQINVQNEEKIDTDKEVNTKYGKLSIIGEANSMQLFYKDVKLRDGDGYLLAFKNKFNIGASEIVLVLNNSGGTACPAQYFFVETNEGGAHVSQEFGNCSDLAEASIVDSKVIVKMPKAEGNFSSYTYSNGAVEEDASPIMKTEKSQHTTDVFIIPAVISDPDGYTNIRASESASSEIIGKITEGEKFYTFLQEGTWWKVRTQSGTTGFVHKSRIKTLEPVASSSKDCPSINAINEILAADTQCQNSGKGEACSKFVNLFENLIPSHNCRRSFDTKPVPAIWLAGGESLEKYILHLSKLKSPEAVKLFSSAQFRSILDGSLAEQYVPLSLKAGG